MPIDLAAGIESETGAGRELTNPRKQDRGIGSKERGQGRVVWNGRRRRRIDAPTGSVLALLLVAVSVLGGCVTDFGPPAATFDGRRCSYDGLKEFSIDDTITVELVNRSREHAGISVWMITGVGVEEVVEDGPRAHLNPEADLRGVADAAPGDSAFVDLNLDASGPYVLNCFVDGVDYVAAVIFVARD